MKKRNPRKPAPLVYEGMFGDTDPVKIATWLGRPLPPDFLRRKIRITVEVVDG